MQNYKQPGCVLTLTAPYARDSGQGALVGAIFGVATSDVENGASGEFATEGVFELAKTASQAWTAGDRIYWNTSTKAVSNVATVGPFIGVATEAVAGGAGDTTGTVKLSGAAPELSLGVQANIAALTAGVNITAATANGVLTDSSGTNPTEGQFNELAKELLVKVNAIIAALVAAGIVAAP